MSAHNALGRAASYSVLAVVTLALAACGGGGGGGSTVTPPSSAKSGLVPVAPVAGDVLESDATTLRVLRPGAVWTYHGVDLPYGAGAEPVVYSNVVTHTSAPVGAMEDSSNLFNTGSDTSNIQAVAGTIKAPDSVLPVSSMAPDAIEALELRSPVRVADQYTTYDKHFDDGGEDLDGDGVHEGLDIAIWSRVVGVETIDLVHQRRVRAIRVDTTLAERVKYSKTGTYSDVAELVRRVWYAKGIGIVKMQLDQPGPNVPSVRHVTTEVLDTWDGLTQGVGYLPVQTVLPSPTLALSTSTPIGAAAFDDHAVVMSFIPETVQAEGVRFISIDLRGRAQSSVDQRGMAVASQQFVPEQLLRVSNELRLVVLVNEGLAMLGFDASGKSLTLPLTTLVPHGGFMSDADAKVVQAASVGNRIWLMWLSPNLDSTGSIASADLKLQQFNESGLPLGAPVVLEAGIIMNGLRHAQLSAAADRTVASWSIAGTAGAQHYAVLDSTSGAVLALKTLSPASTGDGQFYGLQPLTMNTGLALVFNSDASFGALAGVQLDASFDPIRSTTGTLGNEVVSQSWTSFVSYPALTCAGFGRAFVGIPGYAKLWPEDAQAMTLQQVAELVPGNGALASSGTLRLLAQVPDLQADYLLPYADRLLVIGTRANSMVTTAVWRQP